MKRIIVAALVLMASFVVGGAVSPTQAYYRKPVRSHKVVRRAPAKRLSYHAHFPAGRTVSMMPNAEGKVLLTWDARGGTCNFGYTEAGQQVYKYRTSAGCDGGSLWVGGLVPGRSYRFVMSQGNWEAWSRPQHARATGMMIPMAR